MSVNTAGGCVRLVVVVVLVEPGGTVVEVVDEEVVDEDVVEESSLVGGVGGGVGGGGGGVGGGVGGVGGGGGGSTAGCRRCDSAELEPMSAHTKPETARNAAAPTRIDTSARLTHLLLMLLLSRLSTAARSTLNGFPLISLLYAWENDETLPAGQLALLGIGHIGPDHLMH